MANVIDVVLFRSNVNVPWGFALQGGRDHHAALTVSKVIPRSPAEGKLEVGEAVLAINGMDVESAAHMQIVNLVKSATGQLRITLNRKSIGRQVFVTSTEPRISQPTSTNYKPTSYREAHAMYAASPHAIRPQTYSEAHDLPLSPRPTTQRRKTPLFPVPKHQPHQKPLSVQIPKGQFLPSPRPPPRQPIVYQVANNRFGPSQTDQTSSQPPKILIAAPKNLPGFQVADNRARIASPSPKLQVRNAANKPIVFSVSDNRGFAHPGPVNGSPLRSQTPDRTPVRPLPPSPGRPQLRRTSSAGRFQGAHPVQYYSGNYMNENHMYQPVASPLPHKKPVFRVANNRFG